MTGMDRAGAGHEQGRSRDEQGRGRAGAGHTCRGMCKKTYPLHLVLVRVSCARVTPSARMTPSAQPNGLPSSLLTFYEAGY